jgi:hypothetical protein
MKTPCFLVAVLALAAGAANLNAQSTNTDKSVPDDQTIQRALEIRLTVEQPKLSEIMRQRVTYDGVLVTAARSHRLWELLNPAAPLEYGALEDTIVRDPISGRLSGVKLFSIRF